MRGSADVGVCRCGGLQMQSSGSGLSSPANEARLPSPVTEVRYTRFVSLSVMLFLF